MTVSDLDDIDEASSLTGSDLKGLLKAARLAKYVPDSKSSSDPVVFEKSANLLKLTTTKICKNKYSAKSITFFPNFKKSAR